MGIMTIDGQSIEFTDEPNVLSVSRDRHPYIVLSFRIIYIWSLSSLYSGK